MTKDNICREIIRLTTEVNTQTFMLDALKESIADNDSVKLDHVLTELVLLSEANTLKMRDIAVHISGGKLVLTEPFYGKKVVPMNDVISRDVHSIKISALNEHIEIKLPSLMPTSHQDKTKSIFAAPLISAFERYVKDGNALPYYTDAVIAFEHVICSTHPIVADNDNYAYRKLANIVASFVLSDDDSASCSFFYTSRFAPDGSKSHTIIHVIPKQGFAKWLSERSFWEEAKAA